MSFSVRVMGFLQVSGSSDKLAKCVMLEPRSDLDGVRHMRLLNDRPEGLEVLSSCGGSGMFGDQNTRDTVDM